MENEKIRIIKIEPKLSPWIENPITQEEYNEVLRAYLLKSPDEIRQLFNERMFERMQLFKANEGGGNLGIECIAFKDAKNISEKVSPNICFFCQFGHMIDCHWPFDCSSEYCTKYKDEEPDFDDWVEE